ncbi:copper resistance system multicopper oxidase [Parathalassolituus penaei]|uniref:Copper resistance system multicopper oxidase n=1 Tax=Parathalassolituus penaei TaxID=2997323 RepID=A0A9X3EFR1_9GAMM|nr:copper resistance system multicopper oxidase [Parathalassolituus penaei]MCY0966717.1 copper resistance system multicopper oxidase [Parathalassolituus penaei]
MSAIWTPQCSRRRFVQGIGAAALLGGGSRSWAQDAVANAAASPLTGTEFDLYIDQTPVNFTGSRRLAYTVNGSLPAPTLVWREGETVTIRVHNRLSEPTAIHWHGILLPYEMDGVPGLSFGGIAAGATFTYQFKVRQSGTYWYHSHSGFQELQGLYGAIVILPRDGERIRADRDYVIQMADWSDENPMRILQKLKSNAGYYNYIKPTAPDFFSDVRQYGLQQALSKRDMWNDMRMSPTDLADVSAETYTYLLNGQTPSSNWTGLFRPGETVRLRLINSAGNTFYDFRIPGLPLTVVQADGQDVEPVTVDELRMGPGQTCDLLVRPKDDAYTLFAQNMDRSGYARGTLAVAAGLTAPVPALDKPEWLSMADMMGNMNHGGGQSGHAGHGGQSLDHSAHSGQPAMDHSSMAGMDHSSMAGMDHSSMAGMDHSGMAGMNHGSQGKPGIAVPSQTVSHASTEYGPSVDMRVDTPRTNLDDPGIGLRNNGRRVLTLNDLHTIGGSMDKRLPEREIELHLTGNMERYSWSFDGLEFGQSTPVHFRHGERVRVILQNDTMMTHPMHMHGLWSELENDRGEFMARLHTIPVQPAQRISFQVTADALGRWAWHCHLMFHMDSGMFREVLVA